MDSLANLIVFLLGGVGSVYLYTKLRNNSVIKDNSKTKEEVQKLEGKIEGLEKQQEEKSKEIDKINEETKNELEKKQTLEQLSSFFNSMFK